jgi:hypothetical protein
MVLFNNEMLGRLLYHHDKNGRKRRTEAVEGALFLALGTIIDGLDLHKMQYGYYDPNNNFIYYNYSDILKKSAGLLTESRLDEAMSLLKALGFLTVTCIYKTLHDGRIITVETRIEVSDDVFKMLGIYEQFLKDRGHAASRFYKREKINKAREKYLSINVPSLPYDRKRKPLKDGIHTLSHKMTTPYKPAEPGHGQQMQDMMKTCISSGMTIQEAAAHVKAKFYPSPQPPPH